MKTIRILIADDHPVVREGLVGMLEGQSDFEVVGVADDGDRAVTLYDDLAPDVILMDLQMPGISGFEASSQITEFYKDKENKPIIIALTANAMKSSVDDGKKVGMSDYLLKPIKSETLKKVLMKYAAS